MKIKRQSTPRSGSRWIGLSLAVALLGSLPVVASPAAARDGIASGGAGFAQQASSTRTLSAVRTGALKIVKSFTTNGYSGNPSFAITYQCPGKSGTVSLKAGRSATINNVRAGNCKVTEKALKHPSGWTYAAPTYSPAQTVAVVAGKTVTVTVNNVINRNVGSLKITKVFDANGYGGDPTFEIGYTCAGASGSVLLKGGATATVPGVPTGDCTVSEQPLTNPPGWIYADPAFSPARTVPVLIGKTAEVTVTNTITRRSPQTDTVFNYPEPGQTDPAIRNKLVQLLAGVPSGAEVSAALYIIFPDYPVLDALIDAHDRGAAVQVVLDSGNRGSAATNQAIDEAFALLVDELGSDPGAQSFAIQCERACISKEANSIQHNKFVLMSATGDQADVVFQTTANMTTTGSGEAQWNAAVVNSGTPEVYASYKAYFTDLADQRSVDGNNYNAVRPPATYGKFTPHYFPRTDGIDTVAQTLAGVNCSGSTAVDVMANYFVRPTVRDQLTQMAQAGCGVRVLARVDNISRAMCDSLVAQAVTVRVGDAPSATDVGIHGKYLTVTGGVDNRHLVWMGSHNLTHNALLRNDETFMLIDDQQVHDEFRTNFDIIWNQPAMTDGCQTVLE